MKTIPRFVVVSVAALLVLCGCSPSASDARKVLEHRVEKESGGAIRVVNLRKTNSQSAANIYRVEYEAEIEFLKAGSWTKGGIAEAHIYYAFSDRTMGGGAVEQFTASVMGAVNVFQGQHQTVKDYCDFEKTEQGWRAEDGQIY